MNFTAFLSYIFVSSTTPGPNNIISMTNGSRYGVKGAVPYASGVFVGMCLLTGFAAFFGAALYDAIPSIEPVMRVLGAAYIVYLAFSILADKPKSSKKYSLDTTKMLSGLLLQFINVKAYLYAITTMSSFVLPYYRGAALLGFVLIMAFMAFISNILWALFGSAFDRFFKKHKKVLNWIMFLLLLYCAVSMIWDIGG